MKKYFFYLSFVLTLLLVFNSCAKVIENDNFATEGYILIDGEKVVPEYVLKINDNEISLAEYRYYYLNQKAELDGGDDSVWEDYPEYLEDLNKYVNDTLVEVYAIRSLAKDSNVDPNVEEVASQINEYKKGLSSNEYKKGLKEFHLTDELYEYILQGYQLYSSLFDFYFGEDGEKSMSEKKILEYTRDNYVHLKHIFIYPNTTMSDEEYESYLNNVLKEAKESDDFDSVVDKYSKDTAMPSYGYYFTEEEMPEEFIQVCDELEAGEISGLVKSSYGYHVIKKLDVDKNDIDELTDVVYNELFADIINEKIENTVIEYSPDYYYITPQSLK